MAEIVEGGVGEVWRPIAGFEGLYEVSNLGRVKSLARRVWVGGKKRQCWVSVRERILKPRTKRDGYLKVDLSDSNGNRTTQQLHRLVAQAFIPNPDNLPEVNHIDENKQNNRVENLEWLTHELNKQHSAKLTAVAVREIRKLYKEGKTQQQIADLFGISRQQVSFIVRREVWKNIVPARPPRRRPFRLMRASRSVYRALRVFSVPGDKARLVCGK